MRRRSFWMQMPESEQAVADRKAAKRLQQREAKKKPPLLHDTPQARCVQDCGGVLVLACFRDVGHESLIEELKEEGRRKGYAPFCGRNNVFLGWAGGVYVRCGSILTDLRENKTLQVCDECRAAGIIK